MVGVGSLKLRASKSLDSSAQWLGLAKVVELHNPIHEFSAGLQKRRKPLTTAAQRFAEGLKPI